MADNDNPNKSNKSINGQQPSSPGWVEKVEAQRIRDIQDKPLDNQKMAELLNEETQLDLRLSQLKAANNQSSQTYRDLQEQKGFILGDIGQLDERIYRGINTSAADYITTRAQPENITARTTHMASDPKYFVQAKNDKAGLMRYSPEIQTGIRSDEQKLGMLLNSIAGEQRGLGADYDTPESLTKKMTQATELEDKIAYSKKLYKVQNKLGYSTEKLIGGAEGVVEKSKKYFGGKELEERVLTGKTESYEKEEAKYRKNVKRLERTQQAYEMAPGILGERVAQGKMTEDEKNEKIIDLTKAMMDLKDTVEENSSILGIKAAHGQGPDDMGPGDVGKMLELVGKAGSHVVRSSRVVAVDQRIEQLGHKAAYAATANRIYDRAEGAIMGGDMDALMELTGGSLISAEQDAARAKSWTNNTEFAAQVLDVAAAAGRTTQAYVEGTKASVVGGKITAGAQGVIETTDAVVKASDLGRGNIQSRLQLPMYGGRLEVDTQLRAMKAKMMQGVYNQGMGAYGAVAGLGDAAGMASQLMDPRMLGALSDVGIQGTQANQLAGMMGAAGSTSAAAKMNVIESAGRAKQRGQLGREEYVGMAAQLMGAGGGAADLEKSIAAGFDNSKLASEMVSATLDLSANLRGMGISSSTSTQDMLGKVAQDMQAAGIDKNLSVLAAANSTKNLNKDMSNLDFNLGNIMEFSDIKQKFGGNQFQIENIQSLNMDDFGVLMAGAKATDEEGDTPEQRKQKEKRRQQAKLLMERKGIANQLGAGTGGQANIEDLQFLIRTDISKNVVNKGGLGVGGVVPEEIVQAATEGKFTQKQMAWVSKSGYSPESLISAAQGNLIPKPDKDVNNKEIPGYKIENAQAKMQYKVLTDAMKESNSNLKEIFDGLGEQIATLSDNIGPSVVGQEASRAAEKMKAASGQFLQGAEQFNKGIGKLFKDWTAKAASDADVGQTAVRPAVESQGTSSSDSKRGDH